MKCWVIAAAVVAVAAAAAAQAPSPYAGLGGRPIKAVSPEEAADLVAGRGMGLALAAELNGFPGPMHVLELADALALAPEQRAASAALMAPVRERAQSLGRDVLAAEAELDRGFAAATIDAETVRMLTARIAALRGALRTVHLEAHIAQRALLRPEQIARYDVLRGYRDAPSPAPQQHQRHHRQHP